MIFTWSGKGYMVPLAASLSTLGLMGLTSLLDITVQDEVISIIASAASSIFIWKLHFWVKENRSLMTIVDEESGETEKLRIRHDFCSFPLWFWALVFAGFGIYTAVELVYPALLA